ncbi:hypothetical protein QFZ63_001559 [Streptomyces sp. B3I7]|uniref:hypothetical protein n=1 Tax=Streptomyces sp. B3I7 TaxID=3042269 RepID=UPI002780F302|nr:hypothetical protein [Streptomyces sp. B3I7]MDQ0809845.1 hypothetical protein [Streptomyces sp. B3I7]
MTVKTTTRHRGIHWVLADGSPPSELFDRYPASRASVSLTETREAILRARRAADVFHVYDVTDRDGAGLHIAYARYNGASHNGHVVTYIYELATDAVLASCGFAPRA